MPVPLASTLMQSAPVLDLGAGRLKHLLRPVYHDAQSRAVVHPVAVHVGQPSGSGEDAAAGLHSWPFDHPLVDHVAQGDRDQAPGPDVAGAREPDLQQGLSVARREDGGMLHGAAQVIVFEAGDIRVGGMKVTVDHARHDGAAREVHRLTLAVGRRLHLVHRANGGDALALDEHAASIQRLGAHPIDDAPVLQQQISVHHALPRRSWRRRSPRDRQCVSLISSSSTAAVLHHSINRLTRPSRARTTLGSGVGWKRAAYNGVTTLSPGFARRSDEDVP